MAGKDETSDGSVSDSLWARAKLVLGDALDLPPSERRAYIQETCAGEPELQSEVESLLPTEDAAESFLAKPATDIFELPGPALGMRVGGYTLRSLIGEGGMGHVFEAVQEHPHRTVALKVLRPGLLAADAERRFQYEIEALGRLSHPSIASIHDAGVESVDGGTRLSWFAMEKVAGQSLLAAARELKLDDNARLRLFLRVTDGVAHAHQRGVIHRDLKPDNILVDESAHPHLLDFGIARVADPMASSMTMAGEIIGTLAYMSPEQLLGDPSAVDARADVYALGVILFHLMTGHPPRDFDGLGFPQAALRITESEARRAGDLRRDLHGKDLETVLVKALEHDPDQRYPSVEAFARDIRRVLDHEPIEARAPSAWYQVSKFTRRHRGLVAGGLMSAAALVVAVIGTSVGFYRASAARDQVIQERDHAEAINGLVTTMFASADPTMDGHDVRVVDLLDAARADLASESDEQGSLETRTRAGLNLTLGNTYRMLALHDDALPLLLRAEQLYEQLDGTGAASTVGAFGDRLNSMIELGQLEAAEPLLADLHERTGELTDPADFLIMRPLEVDSVMADMTGDLVAIEAAALAVLRGWTERAEPGSSKLESARVNYAVALMDNGKYHDALEHLREGKRNLDGAQGPRSKTYLAVLVSIAQVLSSLGSPEEALLRYQELLPQIRSQWGDDHENTLSVRASMGNALSSLGRHDEAVQTYQEVVADTVRVRPPNHYDVILAKSNLGIVAQVAGRNELALEQLKEALAAVELGRIDDRTMQVRIRMNLASVLETAGRDAEALSTNRDCLAWIEENLGLDHSVAIIARNNTAMMLVKMNQGAEALTLASQNLELSMASQPEAPMNLYPLQMNLGRALAAAGETQRAETLFLEVRAKLHAVEGTPASQLARLDEVLAEFYTQDGRTDMASQYESVAPESAVR